MDTETGRALVIGAISGGIVAVLGAIGLFIVNNRASKTVAHKSDIAILEGSYANLEGSQDRLRRTYEAANAALNIELGQERTARRADKLECQTQIDNLQRQLTTLLNKLPEPGSVQPVIITGIDTNALPALPVKMSDPDTPLLVKVDNSLPVPVVIKGPLPIHMTAAQVQAKAEAEAEATKTEEPK